MSTVSTATLNRDQLIRSALRKIGNSMPSTDDLAQAATELNLVIKRIDAAGRWLWAIAPGENTLNLVAGQTDYTVGSPPTGILSNILALETALLLRGTNRLYLRVINKDEWLKSYYKEVGASTPVLAYLDREPVMTNQVLHILPKPASNETLLYTVRRRLYDFTAPSDNPDIPAEGVQPLVYMLANSLADDYGVALEERAWIAQKAEKLFHQFQEGQAEDVYPAVLKTQFY